MPPFPKPNKQAETIEISEPVKASSPPKSNQSVIKLSTNTKSSGSIEAPTADQKNIKTGSNETEVTTSFPDQCPPTGLSIISTKPEPDSEGTNHPKKNYYSIKSNT